MKLDVLSSDRVKPEKCHGLLRIEIDIIQLSFDESLCVQVNVDGKQVCYLKVAFIVNIGKVGKEEPCNVAKLVSFLCASIVMNGLSLLKQQCGTHCFVVAHHWFDKATLIEELTNAENNSTMLPQHVGEWADKSESPEKVEEGYVAAQSI